MAAIQLHVVIRAQRGLDADYTTLNCWRNCKKSKELTSGTMLKNRHHATRSEKYWRPSGSIVKLRRAGDKNTANVVDDFKNAILHGSMWLDWLLGGLKAIKCRKSQGPHNQTHIRGADKYRQEHFTIFNLINDEQIRTLSNMEVV